MSTTTNQQTALEKPVVPVAYFVEFQFASGTQRVCNFNQTVTWGGYDWLGLGSLGSISEVEESDGLEAKPMNFALNAAQADWLALAVGDVEEYRGRPAKMYFCPLTPTYQLIDTPVLCWRGIMDTVGVGMDGEEGGITLRCETSAYGLKRQPALRMNAAQQSKRVPGDLGFAYQNDLIARPQTWLSKAFQSI
jgi:hypothetical protein